MTDKLQLTEEMVGERGNDGQIVKWPKQYVTGATFIRENTDAHSVQGVSKAQFVVLPMGHNGLQKGTYELPKKARSTTAPVSGSGDGSG